MKTLSIFFDDLNSEAQQRFLKFMGIDNPSEGNYDVIEIATVVFEDEEVGHTS